MTLVGRWDSVLAQTSSLQLPRDKLISLYEQVFFELLESGERDLAKEVFLFFSLDFYLFMCLYYIVYDGMFSSDSENC